MTFIATWSSIWALLLIASAYNAMTKPPSRAKFAIWFRTASMMLGVLGSCIGVLFFAYDYANSEIPSNQQLVNDAIICLSTLIEGLVGTIIIHGLLVIRTKNPEQQAQVLIELEQERHEQSMEHFQLQMSQMEALASMREQQAELDMAHMQRLDAIADNYARSMERASSADKDTDWSEAPTPMPIRIALPTRPPTQIPSETIRGLGDLTAALQELCLLAPKIKEVSAAIVEMYKSVRLFPAKITTINERLKQTLATLGLINRNRAQGE